MIVPVDGNIGYVNMYGTTGNYAVNSYATKLQSVIRQVDSQRTCGWIVDLRLNTGGSLPPMIEGIGPVSVQIDWRLYGTNQDPVLQEAGVVY